MRGLDFGIGLGGAWTPVSVPSDLYRQWREQAGPGFAFQEARRAGAPPERWLQELWAHQRLQRDALRTTQGRKLLVLHPGFWNREAGPDFLGAVLQFDDREPVSGDVEIDLVPGAWRSHGHLDNPAYANVILHVVWEAPPGVVLLPTLALRESLDGPVEELESWIGGAGDTPIEFLRGQCSAPLRRLPPGDLEALLRQAALVRLQTKALLFRARARASGWHQALWEGVFRALGYKHNGWAMQRLAELLPAARQHPVDTRDPRETWEARLLGLSGLLPAEPKAGTYARRLWDFWWREREPFHSRILPPALWRLNGVRPANHPQRRIALAAQWVADPHWIDRVDEWFRAGRNGTEAEHSLMEAIRPGSGGFWRRHYTLSARELPESLPLLGSARLTDLAINVILPWLWARADTGGEREAATRVESLYTQWSPGEDNAVLKLARARLFGTETLPLRRTAAVQQGLLQIVRDFCGHSNAVCRNCAFPGLVTTLAGLPGTPEASVTEPLH